jgi:O-antigen ligase
VDIQSLVIVTVFALSAALVSTIVGTAAVWAALFRPYFLVLLYLLVFFTFSRSTFGLAEGVTSTVYSRGSGVLLVPLLVWALWGLMAVSLFRSKLLPIPAVQCNLRPWIVAFFLLFLGHVGVGVLLDIPLQEIFSGIGNIANMGFLTLLIVRTVDSKKALELLISLGLMVIAAREVFGIVRFLFCGGDPANPYDLYQQTGSKITFFDINDSLLACIAAAYCCFRLIHDQDSLSRWQRWFFAGLILLGAAIIVFSFRRTNWGGMALVGALIVLLTPAGKRFLVGVPIVAVAGAGLAILYFERLAIVWQRAHIGWSALYYDLVEGGYGQASLRALELQLGWEAFLDKPIFGQGSWGRFAAYSGFGESWHGGAGAYSFVHSGVIHVLFKSGLVGFAIVAGLLCSFAVFVRRAYPLLEPRYRAVLVMGAAGVLFMVPDLIFGPIFTELRTTQLVGFCLALPYVAYHVARQPDKRTS